jgi:hypothetical protein
VAAIFGGAAGGAPGGGGAGCAPGGGFCGTDWFIISIVPLNFGAAAPLMLKPHLTQVVAVSGFFVPQFGQNKTASQSEVIASLKKRVTGAPQASGADDSHPSYT